METSESQKKQEEALDADHGNASNLFDIGRLLWERGEKEKAVEHFVASAKENPSDSLPFRYLGHYYRTVAGDSPRAAKCYQRSVTLNPDDQEAGEALCDLLDSEGKESLEVVVCKEASERSPRAFWAFRRLGYLLVHQRKWQEAVHSLQYAIRGFPGCADLWEALGHAYQKLGMLTAALKSYGRSIELDDAHVFSLMESANIHLMLGSFNKGVEHFRRALEKSPENISALFGTASALLGMAKDCARSGAFAWGASLLKEASDVVKASAHSVGNKSCIWKLYGDIQIEYSKCLPWESESIDVKVDEKVFKASVYSWRKDCFSSVMVAKVCYQRALHLCPWQANTYTDVALSLDMLSSLKEEERSDRINWSLTEKLTLGSLMLESANHDAWVLLGCLSNDNALKQHAFIRSLQVDVSLSVGWAHLGKLYRKIGDVKLARKAFDHARSIDPSLALPWAGMASDTKNEEYSANEAYESGLRAVQILPVSDFQVGLGALAKLSGHLLCPHVLGAMQQAVQHSPFLPESHNLNGLVCEARHDLHKAIIAYRQAKYALSINSWTARDAEIIDVSNNLARSLCLSGYAFDAVKECEELKNRGPLDSRGMQVYALALWQLGQNEMALAEAKHLASVVSNLDPSAAASALGLICRLLYVITGPAYTVSTIARIPSVLLRNPKIASLRYAINALEPGNGLQFPTDLTSMPHREACEIHHILALGKMLTAREGCDIETYKSLDYLKRAIHMHPDSSLLRNELGFYLLQSKDWLASHTATRCIVLPTGLPCYEGSKSPFETIGCALVACYSNSFLEQRCSFTTCRNKFPSRWGIRHLQRWLHKEPWNDKAKYLLALAIMQKAREEKFAKYLCDMLRRLIFNLLSREVYHVDEFHKYQKFQLLLCASEICLQYQEHEECISHAIQASRLEILSSSFFAHLQLCRAYSAMGDWKNLRNEYTNCVKLKTYHEIGWISLSYLSYKYSIRENDSTELEVSFLMKNNIFGSKWLAILNLVICQNLLWQKDLVHAEEALRSVLSISNADKCLLLCHGAICVELARQQLGSEYLYFALSSLSKAQQRIRLPFVPSLHAIVEGSIGAEQQWAKNLRAEWFCWPAEIRPAEVYFQMYLLANKTSSGSNQRGYIEFMQSPDRWVLRAIHLNPSCLRYWMILQNLMSWNYTR